VESEGAVNPLLEAAEQIGRQPDEKQQQGGGSNAADPKPGSFETFMASFGSPKRWAGR